MKNKEAGFTLIELLTIMGIISILMTISAFALRHYWFVRALHGSADQVVSQMREAQENARSETSPFVYGAWFDVGTDKWAIVRYDPLAAGNECTVAGHRSFDDGVVISAASFTEETTIAPTCVPKLAGSTASEFVFFYARGSATSGSVTLVHPSLSGKSRTIEVTPMTGRVTSS
ncbi:MAG: pilus assembly FimT family protein [Actinomycetota bacterium]